MTYIGRVLRNLPRGNLRTLRHASALGKVRILVTEHFAFQSIQIKLQKSLAKIKVLQHCALDRYTLVKHFQPSFPIISGLVSKPKSQVEKTRKGGTQRPPIHTVRPRPTGGHAGPGGHASNHRRTVRQLHGRSSSRSLEQKAI